MAQHTKPAIHNTDAPTHLVLQRISPQEATARGTATLPLPLAQEEPPPVRRNGGGEAGKISNW